MLNYNFFIALICIFNTFLPRIFANARHPPKLVNELEDFFGFDINDYELYDQNEQNSSENNDGHQKPCKYQHAIQQFFEKLLEDYDSNLLPKPYGNKVELEVHVQEISEVSESRSSFVLDLFVSEIWLDDRLAFDKGQVCRSNITIKTEFRSRIWSPGTCMINTKQASLHKSPSDNAFFIIYSTGKIWQNHRMQIRGPCEIDLRAFPFDTQQCFISFETSSYNFQEVELGWYHEPITLFWHGHLPDFYLLKTSVGQSRGEYPNGIWDQLQLTFVFRRKYGFYLTQCYFPTALTVIVSWLTFYLESKALSARVTLSVSALLALTFQFGNVLNHLPRVSYIKCIDVWMIACCLFVFLAMVELAMACHFTRRQTNFRFGRGTQQIKTRWFEMTWLDKKKLNMKKRTIKGDGTTPGSSLNVGSNDNSRDPSPSPLAIQEKSVSPRPQQKSGFNAIRSRLSNFRHRASCRRTTSENFEDKVMAIHNKVTGEIVLVGLDEAEQQQAKQSINESSLQKLQKQSTSGGSGSPKRANSTSPRDIRQGPVLLKYLANIDNDENVRRSLTDEHERSAPPANFSASAPATSSGGSSKSSSIGRCWTWLKRRVANKRARWRKFRMTADRLDRFSRIAFPVGFLVFNLFYWCLYVLLA